MARTLELLHINDLHPSVDNPRSSMGDLSELQESVRASGILAPLIVIPDDDESGFRILAGHRRHAVAQRLGIDEVLAVVEKGLSPLDAQVVMLTENLQRRSLEPADEARAFKRLIDAGMSQHEVAARVGRSQSYICRRILLIDPPQRPSRRRRRVPLPASALVSRETWTTVRCMVCLGSLPLPDDAKPEDVVRIMDGHRSDRPRCSYPLGAPVR